jgi:hippurate hydrolase
VVPDDLPPALVERVVALRRELHRHPEVSGEEEWTARRISRELDDLGIQHRSDVGGHGIIATIAGAGSGPAVALRADIDALPITERTDLPFASEVEGVMHACGHDGHTSMLVGAGAVLAAGDAPLLPVRLLFQPAEENGSGARAMIADGALEGVGAIFAGHVDRHHDAGTLVVTDGPVNAAADRFVVRFSGQGGHGARPHEALDAVVVGSLFVTAIQTIVSREVDPAHPSVVSVGKFQAGSAGNVIAGAAVLEGTIRSQEATVRDHLCEAVERIARAVAQLHDANVDVQISRGSPPVVNHPEPTALAREAAARVAGADRVEVLRTVNMGAEDFGVYLESVPGCYIRYGGRIRDREGYPAHSARFDFDERALGAGAAWLAEVARVAGAHLAAGATLGS